MALLYSLAFLVMSMCICHGAGIIQFTQEDYDSKSHNALLQGISDFVIDQEVVSALKAHFQTDEEVPLEEITNLKSCSCQKLACNCCVRVKMNKIHLNANVCIKVTYLPKNIGIRCEVSVNGKDYFNKEISVSNPPPICLGVPGLKKFAKLCVKFSNLKIQNKQLSGCIELQAKLYKVFVEKVSLGCFRIPIPVMEEEDKSSENVIPADDTQIEMIDSDSSKLGLSLLELLPIETLPETRKCSCAKDTCQCCAHVKVKSIHLDAEVCIKATSLINAIEAEIDVNGKSVFKQKVPIKDTTRFCVKVTDTLKLCVLLKSIKVFGKQMSGCAEVDVKIGKSTITKVQMGCFKVPPVTDDIGIEAAQDFVLASLRSMIEENIGEEDANLIFREPSEDVMKKPTCKSDKDSFSCCMTFKFIKKHSGCAKVAFAQGKLGVVLTFSLDGKVIFNKEVTVKDPPPFCMNVPFVKKASICITLSKLELQKDKVSGCIKLKAKYSGITVGSFDLGCFTLPPKLELEDNAQQVAQEDSLDVYLN